MTARRLPKPTPQQALWRQLDAMETLTRPAASSVVPSAVFEPSARSSMTAPLGAPALFDRVSGTSSGTGWGICLRFLPVPLSEQVTADGRFVPPDAYTVEGAAIQFLDHPAAPQPGQTVVVSYSHTGTAADPRTCRFQSWADVDMVLIGVYENSLFTDGACSYDFVARSAQNWGKEHYRQGSNSIRFRAAGRNRFDLWWDRGFHLGQFSSNAGQVGKLVWNPQQPFDPSLGVSSAATATGALEYWGSHLIEDGGPKIPDNGEYSGYGYSGMVHFRGTDVAFAYQSRRYRSGVSTGSRPARTLWDMSGTFPVRIWEEDLTGVTPSSLDSLEACYDLNGEYLLEVVDLYGNTSQNMLRLSSFNGSSLTTLDELVVPSGYDLIQVWGGPRLMLFNSNKPTSGPTTYSLFSYANGRLDLIRQDPKPEYPYPSEETRGLYQPPQPLFNTTDTDWCFHPTVEGGGYGGGGSPIQVTVDPELDIVPYRQVRRYDLELTGYPRFPGDEIQPPDSSTMRFEVAASHVASDDDWQIAWSGYSNKAVCHAVRTNRDSGWRIGFRGVPNVPTYLNWSALLFDPDHRDFGLGYTDNGYFYLVNLAKDRP